MAWLESGEKNADRRIAIQKEYEKWLEDNPGIKQQVDQLNDESLEHFKKFGIATTAAFAGALFTPGSFLILIESRRQMIKANKKIEERNQVIRKNSPYQQ